MPTWTNWRKLADKEQWYDVEFDYEGPCCYEMGIGGPQYNNIKPVYVGETKNEKTRISEYAREGSHLSKIIDDHLKIGFTLYYRAQAKSSKEEAKQMQDNLLDKYDYDWNIQLNIEENSR